MARTPVSYNACGGMHTAVGGEVMARHVDCGEQTAAGADELERGTNLGQVAVRVGPAVIQWNRCIDHPLPGADAASERARRDAQSRLGAWPC